MALSKTRAVLSALAVIGLTFLFFWKILLTNLILVGVDTFLYFYPYKQYAAEALRQGRLPLWNPHLFMGAPLLANSQVGLFYPLNWPFIWLDAPKQVAWSIGLHIALAGLLALAYARLSLRLSRAGALVVAVLFAFGGYLGAQVEHINQLNAAVWLPLLFLLTDLALAHPNRRWFWFLWLALVVAVTLLAGHAQTVFISLFGLGLYVVWRAVSDHWPPFRRRPGWRDMFGFAGLLGRYLGPLAVASALAAALAAIQLVPTAELSGLSIRSGGLSFREAVSFSLRPTILHYSLLPPLGMDLSQILGEAFGEWVAYVGVTGLLLALLGAWQSVWQAQPRRFLFLAVAGLVLSLGLFTGPLYLALYTLVPGFNLFRVPARWLLLYSFGAAVLAGFGVDALLAPACFRRRLRAAGRRLRHHGWRPAVLIGLLPAGLLALLVWKPVPAATLLAWAGLAAGAAAVMVYCMWPGRSGKQAKAGLSLLVVLLLVELFWAAQTLSYNQPTAPQAYHSMRNAVAFLLAADPPAAKPGPPARFLSLSGITYDPGDLHDLEQIYGNSLSPKALYNLIVATKEKEVLFFNLPLVYGLHSVDGYGGGILPLKRFVTLQQLFLPPDDLSLDGRLREKLRFVPEGRLLSLLNTRWIITDKQFDVWIDDIFYDLQFPARLSARQTIAAGSIPTFPATDIGLVSHLEGAAALPGGSAVAELAVTFSNGSRETFILKAGEQTAEGSYPPDAAHPQARIGVSWPYQAQGVDYIAVFPLATNRPITGLSVTATLPQGRFVLRGVSLINRPTTTSRSVIMSTEGRYRQVHSGDVKIYDNLDVLPRAFVVHRVQVVSNEAQAIAALKDPRFNPAKAIVRVARPGEAPGVVETGQPSAGERVTITGYRPEQVKVEVTLNTPGWLVLTDADYPGWQAAVDGRAAGIVRANLFFRAVKVPAGRHTVTFNFRPGSVYLGAAVSGAAVLLLAAGLFVSGKRRRSGPV